MKTQAQEALELMMDKGEKLTSLSALLLIGCISFPKRICELRKQGYTISQRKIKTASGKYVNEYWMDN